MVMNKKYSGLYYILQKNRENYIKFLVYTVIVGIFTYFYGVSFAGRSFDKAARTLLHDTENMYIFIPYTDVEETIDCNDEIVFDSGIKILDELRGGNGEIVISSSIQFYSHINLKLSEGNLFSENENEVIVFASSPYDVGDEVNILSYNENKVCKVVGVVQNDIFLADIGGCRFDYMEDDDYDMQPPYEYLIADNRQVYDSGVFFLNPNNSFIQNSINSSMCYIYMNGSKDVLETLMKYGDLENINALQNDLISFWEQDDTVLLLCLLLVFVGGIILHNYLSAIGKMREYGIYYMIGATWNRLIVLISTQNLLSFIIGFLLGSSFVYANYKKAVFGMKILFLWSNQLIIFAGILVIYMISIIPIVIKLKNTNPIDLIKKGNKL